MEPRDRRPVTLEQQQEGQYRAALLDQQRTLPDLTPLSDDQHERVTQLYDYAASLAEIPAVTSYLDRDSAKWGYVNLADGRNFKDRATRGLQLKLVAKPGGVFMWAGTNQFLGFDGIPGRRIIPLPADALVAQEFHETDMKARRVYQEFAQLTREDILRRFQRPRFTPKIVITEHDGRYETEYEY